MFQKPIASEEKNDGKRKFLNKNHNICKLLKIKKVYYFT